MQKSGLFGSRVPSKQFSPANVGQMVGQAVGQMPMPKPASRVGLGTRLLGEGWEQRAAALGGLLMGNRNAVSDYHAAQQQEQLFQRQQAMAAQQAQMERMADREDFMFEHDYRRENPMPTAPDAFERALAGAGIDPASEQGRQMYADRAASMTRNPNDEFVVVPIPGVGTYAGPRSGLGEAMGQGVGNGPVGPLTPVQRGGTTSNSGGNFR